MSIYSQRLSLSFDIYQEFLMRLKQSDSELYSYIESLGYVINDKNKYDTAINIPSRKPGTNSKDDWERAANNDKRNNMKIIDIYCATLDNLGKIAVKDGTILDLGCGKGEADSWIRKKSGSEVIRMDFAKNMLGKNNSIVGLHSVLADCQEIPVRDCSVDQIFLTNFDSNSNMNAVLAEGRRVLNNNGELRLTKIYNGRGNLDLKGKNYDDFLRNFMQKHYSNPQIRNRIEHGMKMLEFLNTTIQEDMINFELNGLESSYDFSRFPIIPRGTEDCYFFNIPISIVGRKT